MPLFWGIFFHTIGASSASLCYTPEKKIRGWSWQTYWLAQAVVCWLVLPLFIAVLTIPSLGEVLRLAPVSAMRNAFLLGMAYGIGGTAFGLTIRYIGFSLTYAISVGISCVLGTLIPPLLDGSLLEMTSGTGSGWILTGVFLGAVGIGFCGVAGRRKEKDLEKNEETQNFDFKKGLPLCILAGILSAFYGFAISAGKPISDIAAEFGAGNYQVNVVYIFSNTGAFLTTMIYTLFLHFKYRTLKEYNGSGEVRADRKILRMNYLLAGITGILWYGQFFFYGLGHVRLGKYQFSSWAIHMILLVFVSSLVGVALREWKGTKARTRHMLVTALSVLLLAVMILTFGNYLGGEDI